MDGKDDSPLINPPLTAQVFIDITKPPYNAAGDGVTDDAKAFQDAVNAMTNGIARFSSDESARGPNDRWVADPVAPKSARDTRESD